LAYKIDDHLLDLCGFVETLALDSINLVGHSMGGRNALFYAACFPEKIERLVLVDSRLWDSERSTNALMQMLTHFPLQADTLEAVTDSISKLYPLMSPELASHIARHGYRQGEGGGFVPRYDTRMSLQCQSMGYCTENLWPFLSNLTCPTLIVRGEKSPFLSKEDTTGIVKDLPRGILKEISRSTHLPVQENPEEFKAVVWDFLNSQE
jgi:pimeloyl-ACP methyl ester carboxylesterase